MPRQNVSVRRKLMLAWYKTTTTTTRANSAVKVKAARTIVVRDIRRGRTTAAATAFDIHHDADVGTTAASAARLVDEDVQEALLPLPQAEVEDGVHMTKKMLRRERDRRYLSREETTSNDGAQQQVARRKRQKPVAPAAARRRAREYYTTTRIRSSRGSSCSAPLFLYEHLRTIYVQRMFVFVSK